jgi:hypothetical protein
MHGMLNCLAVAIASNPASVAQIIAPDAPASVLEYTITDESGGPIPVRITLINGDGTDPGTVFDNPDVDPLQLAVRRNVVYDIDGDGAITIPPGEWLVLASRGMEYDVATAHIGASPGSHLKWSATLARAINTAGWAGGDFHLHTLTHSGHGDSNMPERMISIAGEGVEFAVATDHNTNTDYLPTMRDVGADSHFTAVTGNEISSSHGHYNAYPLDPAASVIDWHAEAPAVFAEAHANRHDSGASPVVQVNHPRWGNIDYFGTRSLDPWTGESDHPHWSWDFDAVEVMNENAGWGWYDAEIDDHAVDTSRHSVMRDWINMINAGRSIAPMGNSDSHTVEANFAGIPRTYVRVDDSSPEQISPIEVTDAIRRGAVLATTGPFITVLANGGGPGDLVTPTDDLVELSIGVQAAPWIPVDRIRVLADGDQIFMFDLAEDGYTPPLAIGPLSIQPHEDAWITVIAESDRSMAPVVRDRRRPIRPLAVTGPIRIDADNNGTWTPPLATAAIAAAEAQGEWAALAANWTRSGPHGRAMLVRAAATNPDLANDAIAAALADPDRLVRGVGIQAAASVNDPTLRPQLAAIIADPESDRALAYAAWAACDQMEPDPDLFDQYVNRFGLDAARRFAKEHPMRLPGEFVREWEVTGYFDAPSMEMLAAKQAPEPGIVHITPPRTKDGHPLAWTRAEASPAGHVNLDDGTDDADHAVAYARTTINSPKTHQRPFTIGSDDGCRIWIGDTLVWDDANHQGAVPDAKSFEAMLQEGPNEVLVKVLNGTGDFGFYLRAAPEVPDTN